MIRVLQLLRHHGNEIPPPEKLGISPAQVRIIDFLYDAGVTTISECAGGLGLTPPTVSVAVRKLEAAGVVERGEGEDGRSSPVGLTRRGRAIREKIHSFRTARVESMLSALSSPERETLLRLLERIVGAEQGRGVAASGEKGRLR